MRLILSSIVLSLLLNLGFSGNAFAETSVDVSNNGDDSKSNVSITTNTGENTICVNGKCTTTSNNTDSKSTVCVNGKCYTSDDGSINVKSEDGKTTVNIESSGDSASGSSITPSPTIEKKIMDKKAGMEAAKKEIKKKLEQKHFDIGQMIRSFGKFILSFIF